MKNQIVLQNAMTAKAVFYGIMSIFLCLFSSKFANLSGAVGSNMIFGVGLVFFNLSALTLIALLKGNMEDNVFKALITADIVLVTILFGSMAMMALPFNTVGYIFTGMMASMVACLAYGQHYGLKYKVERSIVQFREMEIVKSDAA